MPEVRAPFLSSTEPLKISVLFMGIIVGLVLLMFAVVTAAVIWRKKRSGRERREGSEFSCLTGRVSGPMEVWLPRYWKVPSTHMWNMN